MIPYADLAEDVCSSLKIEKDDLSLSLSWDHKHGWTWSAQVDVTVESPDPGQAAAISFEGVGRSPAEATSALLRVAKDWMGRKVRPVLKPVPKD